MAADLSLNYRGVEGTETVTLYVRLSESDFAPPQTVTNAKRRAPNFEDLQVAGALLASQALVWHLWKATLGGTTPTIGDVLETAAGERYVVKAVATQSLTQRYRLVCLKEGVNVS
jgi:hypothetical protein